MNEEWINEYEEALNFYTRSTVLAILEDEDLDDYDRQLFFQGYRQCQNDVMNAFDDVNKEN